MKFLNITLSFLMLFTINKVSAQQVSKMEIQVTGLTCSMCSQATEKSIRTLNYVSDVTPDLNNNIFVVSFKDGNKVNYDEIGKKVQDAGFSVGELSVTINFNNAKIDENGQTIVNGKIYRFVNLKNKTLNGATKVTLIDKGFLSNSAFKKKAATIKLDSYATGSTLINGKKTRVYHLSI